MGKMEKIIRDEIGRLAKKEIRKFFGPIKKENTELKRKVKKLERRIATLTKTLPEKKKPKKAPIGEVAASEAEVKTARISPKWIRNLRKRLNISQHDLAELMAVSPAAVQSWEQGRSEPRSKNRINLVAIRKLGRRDIKKALKAKAKKGEEKPKKAAPKSKQAAPKKKKKPGRPKKRSTRKKTAKKKAASKNKPTPRKKAEKK